MFLQRPRHPRRDCQPDLRFTADELRLLQKAAVLRGETLSRIVRKAAIEAAWSTLRDAAYGRLKTGAGEDIWT